MGQIAHERDKLRRFVPHIPHGEIIPGSTSDMFTQTLTAGGSWIHAPIGVSYFLSGTLLGHQPTFSFASCLLLSPQHIGITITAMLSKQVTFVLRPHKVPEVAYSAPPNLILGQVHTPCAVFIKIKRSYPLTFSNVLATFTWKEPTRMAGMHRSTW
jgi:hypothetical protein